MFTPADHDFMQRALQLASSGFTATPNPRVGCVVVRDNAIVGEAGTGELASRTPRCSRSRKPASARAGARPT